VDRSRWPPSCHAALLWPTVASPQMGNCGCSKRVAAFDDDTDLVESKPTLGKRQIRFSEVVVTVAFETAAVATAEAVTAVADGKDKDYRVRLRNAAGDQVSPWHDVPLRSAEEGFLNMVVEVPRMTQRRMEVSTTEAYNPIAHGGDYQGPISWNFGMFPQTWASPSLQNGELGASGNDEPIDVVEIGSSALPTGSIAQVWVLGALAMLDDNGLGWKVICISKGDPLAEELQDIGDVEEKCPGVISSIREWLRWCKCKKPDEKPQSGFGFDEQAVDRARTQQVLTETHKAWQWLCEGTAGRKGVWLPSGKLGLNSLMGG